MMIDRPLVAEAFERSMQQEMALARIAFGELQASLEGESKSTAGDKHETGRAMVQLEMERAAARLARMEENWRVWQALAVSTPRMDVRPGAMVLTEQGGFFIGLAWNAVEGPDGSVWRGISSDAPLALALKGGSEGSVVAFRGNNWRILAVA